jgi:DNA-binding beta-propeller fold protein YncE
MSLRWGAVLGCVAFALAAACTSFSSADAPAPGADGGTDAPTVPGPDPGVDGGPVAFEAGLAPCSAGTCQVELFATVAGAANKALGIAVTGSDVYVALEGIDVHRFDKATRSEVGVQDFSGVEYITVDGQTLYGTTGNDGEWASVSLGGGALVRNTIGGGPLGIAVAGGKLFLADSTQGTVTVQDLADGGPTPLATMLRSPEGLAVDPSQVYYVAENAGSEIKRGSQLAAATPFDVDVPPGPAGVAVDDTYVYYACQVSREVYRKRKDDSAPRQLLQACPVGLRPGGVAVDATHVYWTVYETNQIWRVAK